jgi:hypothetical protein
VTFATRVGAVLFGFWVAMLAEYLAIAVGTRMPHATGIT